MPAPHTLFTCAHCDAQFPKWSGRCLECGEWGGLKEMQNANLKSHSGGHQVLAAQAMPFSEITLQSTERLTTHVPELDRVFGGGIVPGSLMFLTGEPGIGKSTLVLQIADALTSPTPPYQGGETDPPPPLNKGGARTGGSVLYISGEESGAQIRMRLDRLEIPARSILFVGETDTDVVCATIEKEKPALAIVDSVQTLAAGSIEGEAGNAAQLKAAAGALMACAKKTGVPIIMIGHLTKEGALAGPRTLEHMVDVVLYLEGDRYHTLRMLRAIKNRFGATGEVGIFEMYEQGLKPVENPSACFLRERGAVVPGSMITSTMQGSRPMLVEIQALVTKTNFGYPQRRTQGFDLNRLQMLIAVLTRRLKVPLESHDIFINVVQGMTIDDPGADLAVCLALCGALRDKVLPKEMIALGEVGLGGEVRGVAGIEARVREAEALGFAIAVVPKGARLDVSKIKIAPVADLRELVVRVLEAS